MGTIYLLVKQYKNSVYDYNTQNIFFTCWNYCCNIVGLYSYHLFSFFPSKFNSLQQVLSLRMIFSQNFDIFINVILIPCSTAWFVTSTVLINSFISLYPSFKCHSVKGKFSHTLSKFKMSKMKWDSLLTKSTSWVLVAVYLYFSIFHRDQKFS